MLRAGWELLIWSGLFRRPRQMKSRESVYVLYPERRQSQIKGFLYI